VIAVRVFLPTRFVCRPLLRWSWFALVARRAVKSLRGACARGVRRSTGGRVTHGTQRAGAGEAERQRRGLDSRVARVSEGARGWSLP
jgi:hypothetical protein